MRNRFAFGIATTVVLAAGVTTWARQRGEFPAIPVPLPPAVNDFIRVSDLHIFQRGRIDHVRSFPEGVAHVFLIGRDRPIILTPEESESLRAALMPSGDRRAPAMVPPEHHPDDPRFLPRADSPPPPFDTPSRRLPDDQ